MNTIERIQMVCKERQIKIYKLEKDLGFSNGYLYNMKKRGALPDDRLSAIAEYLQVSVGYLTSGEDNVLSVENAHLVAQVRNDHALTEALKIYFALPEEKRKIVVDMINAMR